MKALKIGVVFYRSSFKTTFILGSSYILGKENLLVCIDDRDDKKKISRFPHYFPENVKLLEEGDKYHFLFVDTPGHDANDNMIDACHDVDIIIIGRTPSPGDLPDTIELVAQLKAKYPQKPMAILYGKTTKGQIYSRPEVLEKAAKTVGVPSLKTTIPNSNSSESSLCKVTTTDLKKFKLKKKYSTVFKNIIKEITEMARDHESSQKPKS